MCENNPSAETEQEIAQRRDKVLKRMGRMKPESHEELAERLRQEKRTQKLKPAK